MAFAFHEQENEDGSKTMHVMMDGENVELLQDLAKMLEYNEMWPVIPVALDSFYKLIRGHVLSKEKMGEIFLGSSSFNKAISISDIEQLKVDGKMLEMNIFKNVKEDNSEGD